MPLRLSTWTFMFMVFGLFNLVSSRQANSSCESIRTGDKYYKDYFRICPLPKCEGCPSKQEIRVPGIGFALETSHGAAVVRLHDGTYQQIALIEGDATYTDLLRSLATGPKDRRSDDINSIWELLQYMKTRTQRRLNKLVGRPATPETAILAAMVSALYKETQMWLAMGSEQPIAAAVLSSPDLIKLTTEEVSDVLDCLKLKNLMDDGPYTLDSVWSLSAAYAGYGRGLCPTYTDADTCDEEEWYFPSQSVLHIDFNRESLSGTVDTLKSIQNWGVDAAFIDPDLGHRHEEAWLASAPETDSELYWAAVSARIRELVVSYHWCINELLLTGTSVTDARFKTALRDALHDIVAGDVLAVLDDNSDNTVNAEEWKDMFAFATARGAAEVAKRRQEGPVKCRQTDECRARRENQRPATFRVQGTDGNQEL
ncbi:hypothetical protein CJF32_00000872 [Rutstroemia sp. NJR-2017a WRK4]|nr:hypothetical protein CJF32_00000872 [Rutstroemia sp. NJR-2017a WRK4]